VRNASGVKLQRPTSGANRRPNPVQHAGDASNMVIDIHRSVLENLRGGVFSQISRAGSQPSTLQPG
jgi:hypothetical protein